jgi:hypothetical protein
MLRVPFACWCFKSPSKLLSRKLCVDACSWAHLDSPVLIHQQVGALEVAVHDGRGAGVEEEHASGSINRPHGL